MSKMVNMIGNAVGPGGSLMLAGSFQTLPDADAQRLVNSGVASFSTGAPSTFGGTFAQLMARIRAGIAAAAASNSVINTPWNPPINMATGAPLTALAGNTWYGSGVAALNGTHVYINNPGAGIVKTPAVPTQPIGTGPALVTDGANVNWQYLGENRVSTTQYDAPLATLTATVADLTNAVATYGSAPVAHAPAPTQNGAFFFSGGEPLVNPYQNAVICMSHADVGNGNLGYQVPQYGYGISVSTQSMAFYTDAPKLAIAVANPAISQIAPVDVEVDDRRVVEGSFAYSAGTAAGQVLNPGYIVLDWTGANAAGRRVRKIRASLEAPIGFSGVLVDPASTVWATTSAHRYRILIDGDSTTGGAVTPNDTTGFICPTLSWPNQFANLIGCDDVINAAVGGVQNFYTTGSNNCYPYRLPHVIRNAPDVVILAGNHNDGIAPSAAAETAAVVAYLSTLRAALPKALIIGFGPWPSNVTGTFNGTSLGVSYSGAVGSGPAVMAALDAAMGAGFAQFNDPRCIFYSIVNDPLGPWMTAGSAAIMMGYVTGVGPEGTHPSQVGIDYMARRYAAAFKSIVAAVS